MSTTNDRLTALEAEVRRLASLLDWVMLERGKGYKVVDTSSLALPPHVVANSKHKAAVTRFCKPPPPNRVR